MDTPHGPFGDSTRPNREPGIVTDPFAEELRLLKALHETPEILQELQAISGSEFQIQSRLRKTYPADLVRSAMLLMELREKAQGKFTHASRMWLTPQGLQQATPEIIARHKAKRFSHAREPVWDLCCGIGGDTLALAEQVPVIPVDRNPANSLRTEWNVALYETRQSVTGRTADVLSLRLPDQAWIHIDPDQRQGGRRSKRLEHSSPSLDYLQSLPGRVAGGAIKVSPAANFGGKFPQAEIELVSLHGECKVATIWFGALRSAAPWRATLLPQEATLAGDPLLSRADVLPLGSYLYDPDPAVVRAGLVDLLAEKLGIWRLDDAEEYLSSDQLVTSPFLKAFQVLDRLPNNSRLIRQAVAARNFCQIEIKCRHVSVDADAIRRKLLLEGTSPGVLFLARIQGKTQAVLARRL